MFCGTRLLTSRGNKNRLARTLPKAELHDVPPKSGFLQHDWGGIHVSR